MNRIFISASRSRLCCKKQYVLLTRTHLPYTIFTANTTNNFPFLPYFFSFNQLTKDSSLYFPTWWLFIPRGITIPNTLTLFFSFLSLQTCIVPFEATVPKCTASLNSSLCSGLCVEDGDIFYQMKRLTRILEPVYSESIYSCKWKTPFNDTAF